MPLFNMSTNISEIESVARKRAHSELTKQQETVESQGFEDPSRVKPSLGDDKENRISSMPTDPEKSPTIEASPGLTESGSSPPEDKSPSPNSTPTRTPLVQPSLANVANNSQPAVQSSPNMSSSVPAAKPSSAEPPAKRKRLTPSEKAASEAAKSAKQAKLEAEKIQRAEELEKKKKEREEADKQKAGQKAAKETEKVRRAEEREQKRRDKEEEEAKKARSQIKLTAMFKMAPATPKKDKPVVRLEKDQEQVLATTPSEATSELTFYEQVFKPFYVKAHVKLADTRSADVDTCESKSKILEEWVEGKRGELARDHFNLREAFQILSSPIPRGRIYPSVRKIMAEYRDDAPTLIDLTTESQNTQIRQTREALRCVPVKSLKFKEDVRPPYIGTVSTLPSDVKSLSKIARNPTRKDVMPLAYDYESEAEWQEDDGEDVDDLDDDEEDADNDEDMDDFLDDSEDAGPTRLLFSGGMEPESSGLCWENDKQLNETAKMYKYKMEFILETLDHHSGINPFSNEYWTPPPKPKAAANIDVVVTSTSAPTSAAAPNACSKSSSSETKSTTMAPPPVPSDAFQALAPKSTDAKKTPQVLPAALQEELRALLCSMPNLSKLGVIEVFASNHAKCPKAQIKASFDALTEKSGKSWKLRER